MSYEDQVVELLDLADPAREQTTYKTAEGRAFLAAVQTRSHELSRLDASDTLGSRGRRDWRWLAAAAVVAVLATIGVALTVINQEPPVATTPIVEESVPTTEPEAVVEPEPITPSTVAETTPSTEPEADAIGVSGLAIFDGAPAAGDYEALGKSLRVVFASDGQWKDCIRPYCDVHGGIEIQPTQLLSVFGWIEASPAPDLLRTELADTPGLLVGDMTAFEPSHPEATWTGVRFSVDVDPGAGRHPACQVGSGDADFPCVEVPFLSPFFVNEAIDMVPINLYIHGPTEFMVLTKPDGSHYWAAPIWYPYPKGPQGAYEMINERFAELVQTIRFVD